MTNYDILKEYEAHKTPVPSYQEYLESESHCTVYSEVNKSLKEENQQLKELLRDLRDEADGALQAIQKDCESDDWSIFHYPEVQYFYDLITKITNAIGADNDKK